MCKLTVCLPASRPTQPAYPSRLQSTCGAKRVCLFVCLGGLAESRLPVVGDVYMVEDHDPVLWRGASRLQAAAISGLASAGAQQGAEHEAYTERACREQVGGPPPLLFAVGAEAGRQHPRELLTVLRSSCSLTSQRKGSLPRASSYMSRCAYMTFGAADTLRHCLHLLQMHVLIRSS